MMKLSPLIFAALANASVANDIPTILSSNENFSTLVSLVTAAGLGGALSGEGPLTVFAPTVSLKLMHEPSSLFSNLFAS